MGRRALALPAWRAEHELVLRCCRVDLDSTHAARVRELCQSPLDWNILLLAASRNHVLGLVSERLRAVSAEAIPATALEFLSDCSRKTAERNRYLTAELKRVCALFRANGIQALPFAGPLLLALGYRDDSVPEIKNLEFVVAREDVLPARDLLIADGYRRDYTWDAAREAAELRFIRTIGLDRSEDGVHIWLSCDLDPGDYRPRQTLASLTQSTVHLDGDTDSDEIVTLSAPDALLHACIHASRSALSLPLSLIGDAARLATNLKPNDWHAFLNRAASLGARRRALIVLALAHDLLGATYPERVMSAIRSDPEASRLCARVIGNLFSDKDFTPGMRTRVGLQLAARERVIDKVRLLTDLAVLPTREDWTIARLPASLYYFVRPLRMLGRRAGLFRRKRLAVFMPTPIEVVEAMLAVAEVGPNDTVYDLGCGDGRIVICAAQRYGARGVGVDLDPDRVAEAQASAVAAGVDHLVTFRQQNVMEMDVSPASVVCLFLSPEANLMLRSKLIEKLPPHARIVSRSHDMGDWLPLTTKLVACDGAISRIYLWRVERKPKPQPVGV